MVNPVLQEARAPIDIESKTEVVEDVAATPYEDLTYQMKQFVEAYVSQKYKHHAVPFLSREKLQQNALRVLKSIIAVMSLFVPGLAKLIVVTSSQARHQQKEAAPDEQYSGIV